MLAAQLKPKEEILAKIFGKRVFIFECIGCEEVYFPREDVEKFIKELEEEITGKAVLDYLCNREFAREYLRGYISQIK